MRVTQIMWFAGTMLTALVMLAVSATSAAPQPASMPDGRGGSATVQAHPLPALE